MVMLTRLTRRKLIVSLTLALFIAPAATLASASPGAHPLVYVVTAPTSLNCLSDMAAPPGTHCGQFGTVDLVTGAFHQIGPDTPKPQSSLVPGPEGDLLTLTFFGDLESIDLMTGVTTLIGATGLAESAGVLGEVDGKVYATDTNNKLYSVNTTSAAATMIGQTGIPGVPSGDLFDESLYGVGRVLYATFDALSLPCLSLDVTPALYRINPATGATTIVDDTQYTLLGNLSASVDVAGTFYIFRELASAPSPPAPSFGRVFRINLVNGNLKFVSNIDTIASAILGAFPVRQKF